MAPRPPDTGSLPTPRKYAGLHRVDAVCSGCNHWNELDLTALVDAGHGDTPLIRLPLRCSACGSTGHRVVVSGRSYGLGEVPGQL
jgi:hypothetical protein